MVQYLNDCGYKNLVLVDDFSITDKQNNWKQKKYLQLVERDNLFNWLQQSHSPISSIIHLGARTDTTEFDYSIHEKLNVEYSKSIWQYCSKHQIPLIYASSAATYGAGELGYNDDHDVVENLKPLNPYGLSKNEFDKWALHQKQQPPAWTGLKFFNVYGPNECHKGRMASVIWHSFNQINSSGIVKLFKSHRPDFKDGEQLRDFVYVKDLLKVIWWMLQSINNNDWQASKNGLYNLGTGKARSFYDLVCAAFKAVNQQPNVIFIDMPQDIRNKYQYFTQANMDKLYNAGYYTPFYTLEDGVTDYVQNYLAKGAYY